MEIRTNRDGKNGKKNKPSQEKWKEERTESGKQGYTN